MPKTASARKTKASKKTAPVEEVIEEEVVEETTTEETTEETPTTRTRRGVLTPEELLTEFDELVSYIDTECQSQKDRGNTKGTKFLRSVAKQVKLLKAKSTRTLRQKRKTTRKSSNTVSGVMKPVPVSKEMTKFAGWGKDELRSRIDVTRYLCTYVKDNDLQNPEDRRRIVPDTKLRKLLHLGKDEADLTYYQLQQRIQRHFTASNAAAAASTSS